MSFKLRVAATAGALALLTGCAPVPVDSIPGTSPRNVITTSAPAATQAVWPTTQAAPPSPAPPVAAQTADPAGTGTTSGSGSVGGCAADEYRNVDGVCVHRPVQADQPPADATAQCNDGTYSFSKHRSGTCSHHGGVRRWL
jgi:hypothetical protein